MAERSDRALDFDEELEKNEAVLSSFHESSPEVLDNPCNQCPWRRASVPGFLGPHTAREWVLIAHSDSPIACHKTITDDDEMWHPGMKQCAGAAIYRANVMKSPRDREVAVGIANREAVFAHPNQFRQHHKEKEESGETLSK